MARYLVGEQLARLDVPIDAIGETTRVSGTIVFEDDGNVVSEQSKITVWLPGLRSDEDRRDRWARNELFNVSEYPNAEFTVSSISGLSWPLPDSGTQSFQLAGDLTVRDVSKPVSWDVTAEFSGGAVSGQAKTVVTFDQFELSKPTFAFIISVEDEIRLELDIVASIDSG